jgi:hypothetical protein
MFAVQEKVFRCLQRIALTKAFSFVVFAYSLQPSHILLLLVLVNPSPNYDVYHADGFLLARAFDVSAGSCITAPLYVVRPRVFELRRGSRLFT